MDSEVNFEPLTPNFNPKLENEKLEKEKLEAKTSLRLQYEAQVEVIKRQVGDLESVREKLGLSQRKICQLLMVDPSSWSRWVVKKDPAPPQIYRALQWYMALNDKIPGLTPQYFIGKDPEVLHQVALRTMNHAISQEQQQRNSDLENINQELKNYYQLQKLQYEALQKKINWLVLAISISLPCLILTIILLTRHS